MFCPNCGLKQECGCQHCLPRLDPGTPVYFWSADGQGHTCAGCGLSASADWWEELSMQVHDLLERAKIRAKAAEAVK